MAEQELSLLIKLKDEASAQLKQLNREIESNSRNWKEMFSGLSSQLRGAGIAFTALGATITGALAYAYKASEDNRLAVSRLANDLGNLGINYGEVRGEVDGLTQALQESTGVARGEQMSALSQLLIVTKDYQQAIKILPIALDLAAAKQMDATTAAILLGRVIEGDINALHRYGFSMDGVTSAGEALNVIQDRVKGSAQSMLKPMDLLKNALNDLAQAIGDIVAGPIGEFILKIADIVKSIKEWVDANPDAAKSLIDLAVAIGIAATGIGLLALGLAGLIAILGLLGGPVTVVLLLIGLLAAAAIYLMLKWDKTKDFWTNIWNIMKDQLAFYIDIMLGLVEIFVNNTLAGFNLILKGINLLAGTHIPEFPAFSLHREEIKKILLAIGESPKGTSPIDTWTSEVSGGGGISNIGALAPINNFGNYGNLGQTGTMQYGGTQITFNIQGDLTSEKDFFEKVRQYFIQLGYKNVTTGIK